MGNKNSSSLKKVEYFDVNLSEENMESSDILWGHVKQNSESNLLLQPTAPPPPMPELSEPEPGVEGEDESDYEIVDYSCALSFYSKASPEEFKFAPGTQISVRKKRNSIDGMNGMIVDIDETKGAQKFVIYLQNGQLRYLSKDEFIIEDSDYKIPTNQIRKWSRNPIFVPKERGKQNSWWNYIWSRNKKKTNDRSEKIRITPRPLPSAPPLTSVSLIKDRKNNKIYDHSSHQNHKINHVSSNSSIPDNLFIPLDNNKKIFEEDNSPLVSVFQSRSQRNAKKPPRKLRHSRRGPMNESSLMTSTLSVDPTNHMMESSIILPPSCYLSSAHSSPHSSHNSPSTQHPINDFMNHDSSSDSEEIFNNSNILPPSFKNSSCKRKIVMEPQVWNPNHTISIPI